MDKNNYNNNEIDLKLTWTSYRKKQLLEMSVLPIFGIS